MSLPKIVHGKDLSYDYRPSKKSHPQKNLSRQTLFQGKRKPFTTQDTVEGSTSNSPLLEGPYQSLYLHSRLTPTEYNTLKNEAKTSTSQS
jgi:hypothetical protein